MRHGPATDDPVGLLRLLFALLLRLNELSDRSVRRLEDLSQQLTEHPPATLRRGAKLSDEVLRGPSPAEQRTAHIMGAWFLGTFIFSVPMLMTE